MIDIAGLDEDYRATVVDSLRDAEEANANAFYAGGPDVARDIANEYALIADKVEAGMAITESQRDMIFDALENSVNNCAELDLEDAANDYAAAALAVGML